MWGLARSQKPACPCGFDETTCMACSDFKLQAQKTVSLDGKGRVNLNQSEMSRISNAFFKAAKSKEEREMELLVRKKQPVKYRDTNKTPRQRSRRYSREKSRRSRDPLDEDDIKYLNKDEFTTCLNGLFDGFPMNDQLFRAFDTKRDGHIDSDEFSAACITLIRVYGFKVFCTTEEASEELGE